VFGMAYSSMPDAVLWPPYAPMDTAATSSATTAWLMTVETRRRSRNTSTRLGVDALCGVRD